MPVFYILVQPLGVYVKEAEFFYAQGGHTQEWGTRWEPVTANNLDAARDAAETLRRERHLSVTHLPSAVMPELSKLTLEVSEWSVRNFPGTHSGNFERVVLGVCEEAGELAHATLKELQGIRGTPEELQAKARDAIGDIVVYLADLCAKRGWDLGVIVAETWSRVKKRDWVANKQTAHEVQPETDTVGKVWDPSEKRQK